MKETNNNYWGFRNRLILFGVLLSSIVALPAIYYLGQRPWNMLQQQVDEGHMLLGTLATTFEHGDVARMNRFAIEVGPLVAQRTGEVGEERESDDYYPLVAPGQAFNYYLLFSQGITEDELLALFEEQELVYTSFSYTRFNEWYDFWKAELEKRPGLRDIFARYRGLLSRNMIMAEGRDFIIADLYIMLDRGAVSDGFFKENIAFLLEGLPWWESAYPGQPYNLVETDTLYWRASYDRSQGGEPGYDNALVSDPDNWYMPQFDVDDWGVWYTQWYTVESSDDEGTLYNVFSIDFDASAVQQAMKGTLTTLLLAILGVGALIVVIAHLISVRMTRPIVALTEGARAVMRHDCTHTVPSVGSGEFATLIDIFNQMVKWVGEMANLKNSLSKLLSDELADKAAKEGLVLGGQTVECSILFTDFAAFSTLSQKMDAEEVVHLLNRYFGELIPIVKHWNGFPDKYIGDAIVAMFGAPVHFENHAEQAVRAAIEMQRRLRVLNEEIRQEHGVVFEMRIGINSGDVVVGAIGCDMKLEYTSIGDTTNLANRMESCCPIGHVMITEHTYEHIKDCELGNVVIHRHSEGVCVKGYSEPLNAYVIYVDDLDVKLPEVGDDTHRYYQYERVEHDVTQ